MMIIDYKSWIKSYEEEYSAIIRYEDICGNIREEKSPFFEDISKSIHKRGFLTPKEFRNICEWKTKRKKKLYQLNSPDEIKNITGAVVRAKNKVRHQLSELIKLKGIGVPVASAILTVIFPQDYCILDYRAWRALQWISKRTINITEYAKYSKYLDEYRKNTIEQYFEYLEDTKKIALNHHITPRMAEVAHWQYDKKNGILRT